MQSTCVSILICTRDRAESLRATLASIGQCDTPADVPAELLVVDNGSTDGTRAVVNETQLPNIPVRYVHEPRHGKGHAYNTGMAEARGDIFLFTDDDVRVPRGWIEGMCRPIVDGYTDAVQGSVRIAPHLVRPWMRNLHRDWLLSVDFSNVEEPGGLIGANAAFRRTVLRKVPGFDEMLGPGGLGFCDDSFFGAQLLAAGFRIRSAGPLFVEHHFEPSRLDRDNLLTRAKQQGRSGAYFSYHLKHLEIAMPLARALVYRMVLTVRRLPYLIRRPPQEGCPDWELSLVERASWNFQYRRERSRPRRYAKRGLTPLHLNQSAATN